LPLDYFAPQIEVRLLFYRAQNQKQLTRRKRGIPANAAPSPKPLTKMTLGEKDTWHVIAVQPANAADGKKHATSS
jgi:hypothetical protein